MSEVPLNDFVVRSMLSAVGPDEALDSLNLIPAEKVYNFEDKTGTLFQFTGAELRVAIHLPGWRLWPQDFDAIKILRQIQAECGANPGPSVSLKEGDTNAKQDLADHPPLLTNGPGSSNPVDT
jgi:hypothetical protein